MIRNERKHLMARLIRRSSMGRKPNLTGALGLGSMTGGSGWLDDPAKNTWPLIRLFYKKLYFPAPRPLTMAISGFTHFWGPLISFFASPISRLVEIKIIGSGLLIVHYAAKCTFLHLFHWWRLIMIRSLRRRQFAKVGGFNFWMGIQSSCQYSRF